MGKMGAKIATIRSTTNAAIKISEKPLEESTEKTVTIQGSPEEVSKAIAAICTQIMEAQQEQVRKGAVNNNPMIPYVPKPDAPAGPAANPFAFAAQLQQYANAFPQAPGSQIVQQFAQQFAQQAAQSNMSDPFGLNAQAPPTVIPLPDNMAGSVIGRGGSMISSIRQRSGATIKVSDAGKKGTVGASAGQRTINVSGTKQQVEVAAALIYEILNGTGTTADTTAARVTSAMSAAAAYNPASYATTPPGYAVGAYGAPALSALGSLQLGLGGLGGMGYGQAAGYPQYTHFQ
jgi:hypothetical protein